MPTTSNFGWTTPADTDLVKDGAAAIRTLGNGIDTSFLDLKGGTTGQVLSKASNTDLDFSWVAQDDVDAIQKSLIDAEGDLIVGDAADAVQRLAIGSNGNVLTVDTSIDGKIKWAAPAGGGKVLQVVYGGTATTASSSSSTRADTNLTATITPTLNTSKVLVLVAQSGVSKDSANSGNCVSLWLMRGATDLIKFQNEAAHTNTTQRNDIGACSANYLDSPATTSATTYKTQFNSPNNTATVYVQNGGSSTIVLLEIGA